MVTMADVRAATGSNGLVAASLFAGCGGSSIGYRLAGCRVACAVEIDQLARETYRLNADPATVLLEDVRTISGADLLAAAGVEVGQLDILDGSPPCQGLSTLGLRDPDDPRTGLYYEAVRLVGETEPRTFAFENVAALARGKMYGLH